MRVGFVGELGYEIHLPADYAVDVWRALRASGARFQLQAFASRHSACCASRRAISSSVRTPTG